MGGVDDKAVLFNEVGKLDRQAQPPKFPANLKGWKLSSDANRRCVTKMDAIEWDQIESLDPKCCYLLLMSYAVAETKAELSGAPNNIEGSIVFLWNGVHADPVVKATALTKAFALERRLIEDAD